MADGLTLFPERTESLGEGMKLPDEVAAMWRLRELGWGSRRIARELGCSRETVRRWLEKGTWRGYRRGRGRPKTLDGLDTCLDHVANNMFHEAARRMMGAFESRVHLVHLMAQRHRQHPSS